MTTSRPDVVVQLLELGEQLEAERAARLELARELAELRGIHERTARWLRFVAKWVLPPLGTVALAAVGGWLANVRSSSSAGGAAQVRQETAAADHQLLQVLSRSHERLTGRVDAITVNLSLVLGPRWTVPASAPQEPTP